MSFETIRPDDIFKQKAHGKGILIDVREKEEFKKGHIPGAINMPYEELEKHWEEIKKLSEKKQNGCCTTFIIYCERGNSSLLAARAFCMKGYCVKNVFGGLRYYKGPMVCEDFH